MMRDGFGEVRSLLNARDGATVWEQLCEQLDAFPPDALDQMVLPYIEGYVRRWDDAVCVAPQSWVERTLAGEELFFWSIVRKIDLSYQYLGAEDVLRLLASERLGHVTILDLSSNRIGPQGSKLIAESESLGQLEELYLGFNQLQLNDMSVLAEAKNLANLRHLELEHNAFHLRGSFPALASIPWSNTLEYLGLGSNDLSAGKIASFFRGASLPALRRLVLDKNRCARVLTHLANSWDDGHLRALSHLSLMDTSLDANSLTSFFDSGLLAQLELLDLSKNKVVDDIAMRALMDSGNAENLEELVLGRTQVSFECIERLVVTLPALKTLWIPNMHALRPVEQLDMLDRIERVAPHLRCVFS